MDEKDTTLPVLQGTYAELAPVAIFCYDRPDHTKQMLEALASADLANHTPCYAFVDGPKEDATPEQQARCREVVNVIESFRGRLPLHVTVRPRNVGITDNIAPGITQVVRQFGHVIVLEDDIVIAPPFLRFMNDALRLYRDEPRVMGVAGHTFVRESQVRSTMPETFLLPAVSIWGWATWDRAWNHYREDADAMLQEIDAANRTSAFDFGGFPYYTMLSTYRGKRIMWDVGWYASVFLQNGLFLFPNASFVSNIGFSGPGTHQSVDAFCPRIDRHDPIEVVKAPVVIDPGVVAKVQKAFQRYLGNTWLTRWKARLRRLLG